MNRKTREAIDQEYDKAFMGFLAKGAQVAALGPIPLGYPLLPCRCESDAELRRRAVRLRRRELHPVDPWLTHEELADYFERQILARAIMLAARRENHEARQFADRLRAQDVLDRDRMALHLAKQQAADDPHSHMAKLVTEIDHARRQERGRPRRR